MIAPDLHAGEAIALHRRIGGVTDPFELYARLSGDGRADTLLFESHDGAAILMPSAAARIECRGGEVIVSAIGEDGAQVLAQIAREMAGHVTASTPQSLVLTFERSDSSDLDERLRSPSPFAILRALTGLRSRSTEERFTIFCGGIIGFDHVDFFETLPAPAEDPLDFPDFIFWLAESLVVVEVGGDARILCTAIGSDDPLTGHKSYHGAMARLESLHAQCKARPAASPLVPAARTSPPQVDLSDAEFAAVVTRLKENIAAGDVYQIVPSRSFRAPCADPLAAYGRQRKIDPSPYMFFVSSPDHRLFGASPETSVKLTRDGDDRLLEVKPIAGTRRRGATTDEDDRLEADLKLDVKEVAEHIMLVDLARNDVARVSTTGTRRVAKLLTVERYARVMHLVSSVTGRLADGLDALDALVACLNVGTLSGAPKIRAMELLREVERTKRGPYGGAVGWLSGTGEMDTGVIIRSAVVKDGTAFVRAGAGVVHDSDPLAEAAETRMKASAVLSALAEDAR